MTPRRLDPEVVHARLRKIRELMRHLEQLGELSAERLDADPTVRYAVERILTATVDLAVAVNGHVGAAVLGEASAEYAESFRVAARAGVLTPEQAEELARSAGLRNVLVHQYLDIDVRRVVAACERAPAVYGDYVRAVARFLEDARRPGDGGEG